MMWDDVLIRLNEQTTLLEALSAWGGEVHSLRKVSHGINLVYRFEIKQEGFYLRLTHEQLRSEAELFAAISFLHHLFVNKVPVCEPIVSKSLRWIETIRQDEDCFIAHVCKEVPGHGITFDLDDLDIYKKWGKALGSFHQSALIYEQGIHHYTSWSDSLDELEDYVHEENQAIRSILEEVKTYFTKKCITPSNFGLTHGDHREANVLTDGNQIHFIDFDLPSRNWFMEDVCRPFFQPIIDDSYSWHDKIVPYLQGYSLMMPNNSLDLEGLVKQIQFKALEIYLWTKNNWSGEIAPGGANTKAWLDKVYQKLTTRKWIGELAKIM